MCHSPHKREKENPDIDFNYDYLSRIETSNISKVSIEQILSHLVKEDVLVNKKTSLRDSFRRMTSPQNLVNSLYYDTRFNNELKITESRINCEEPTVEESAADINTPSTHDDIRTPLTTNENLSNLAKHGDKAFINMDTKCTALNDSI